MKPLNLPHTFFFSFSFVFSTILHAARFYIIISHLLRDWECDATQSYELNDTKEGHVFRFVLASFSPLTRCVCLCFLLSRVFHYFLRALSFLSNSFLSCVFFRSSWTLFHTFFLSVSFKSLSSGFIYFAAKSSKIDFRATAGMKVIRNLCRRIRRRKKQREKMDASTSFFLTDTQNKLNVCI